MYFVTDIVNIRTQQKISLLYIEFMQQIPQVNQHISVSAKFDN